VANDKIDVVWTPGAFELPVAANALATGGNYAAIICLGAVIRGETTHDQHINRAVSMQLASISVRRRIPVAFGLLTCESLEQAINRAGGTMGNKGSECAEAALRMANLLREIAESGGPF
jgi:6,7-dimethyl-8-ribityllumazine synthase